MNLKAVDTRLLIAILLPLLLVVLAFALGVGAVDIDLGKAIRDIVNQQTSIEMLILHDIRLPRALLAGLVGGTLGLAGAALQGLLRNPLAEPGIIGISNGAALGAVIVFYYGLAGSAWFVLPLGGLVGALLAVSCIFLLVGQSRSIITLILAGVAINAIGGALIALALNFAESPYAMQEIVFWLLGSVANRSFNELYIALPFLVLGWAMMLYCGRFLNALTLGEETAKSLGFNVVRMRLVLILGVAASVGAAVSVAGNIGFIGLVVPHLVRPFVAYEPRRLLLASGLVGAILLLIADIAVQSLPTAAEMKLGVITSLVGAPFFLLLILKSRNTLQ
ncbi:MAG: iron ABC transporter permease [Gammaproteobacteria bacterium]|nr:iron ABC transporter permease [Gammaproteobacteria bacterium]MDH3859224.1 iron ABC transporter permease [Gammaproteobacteria bacterium]